jgi:hypothetical protein
MLKCVVSYEPALDYEKFMQCLTGLIQDGHLDEKGGVKIPMMGYFLDKMNARSMARPTAIPAPAFGISLKVFRLMGFFAGWEKLYLKYTA